MLSYAMVQYYKWAVRFEFTGMDAQFGREIVCSESATHCSCSHTVLCISCKKLIVETITSGVLGGVQ